MNVSKNESEAPKQTSKSGGAVAASEQSSSGGTHRGIDILNGSLRSGLVRFAMPVALTGILEQLSNMIDTVMVGRLMGSAGTSAQAAVGANAPITGFLVALFVGTSLGANVTIANAIGRRDLDAASRAVHTAIVMSLGAFAVVVLGEIIARPLLIALNVPDEILGEAVLFLRIYLLGMPLILLYNFEAAILRSVGITQLPLHALALSAVINVLLDFVFIGALGWGVAGSAMGTDLCYIFSSLWLFQHLRHIDSPVRVDVHKLRLDVPTMRRIIHVGLPAGMQGAVFSVANIVIQSAINSLGTTVMAASSAALSIEYVVYNLLNSYSQACTTFVGQNSGARNYRRCKETLKVSLVEGFITAVLLISVVLVAGRWMVSLFNADSEVIEYGYLRLCYIVPAYVFSMVYEVLSGYMRGFGVSLAPALVTTVVIVGLRLWWVFSVFPSSRTFATVMAIYPISLGANAVCLLALLLVLRPARMREEQQKKAA